MTAFETSPLWLQILLIFMAIYIASLGICIIYSILIEHNSNDKFFDDNGTILFCPGMNTILVLFIIISIFVKAIKQLCRFIITHVI